MLIFLEVVSQYEASQLFELRNCQGDVLVVSLQEGFLDNRHFVFGALG